jgi:hypothetical protein
MKKVAIIAAALVLGVAGIAVAATNNVEVPKASRTSTVKVHDGKPLGARSVGHIQLKNSVISCEKLVPSLRSAVCKLSLISKSDKGDKGDKGDVGPKGDKGAAGDSYLKGAYYAVAYYNAGDTNAGAIATVACKDQSDVAMSGGVQVLGLDAGANGRNTPVSSSFPGRMDWDTNTPKVGRLDGWIVQFGGNAGPVSDKDPQKAKVWALCVPGLDVPVVPTYTQSPSS